MARLYIALPHPPSEVYLTALLTEPSTISNAADDDDEDAGHARHSYFLLLNLFILTDAEDIPSASLR